MTMSWKMCVSMETNTWTYATTSVTLRDEGSGGQLYVQRNWSLTMKLYVWYQSTQKGRTTWPYLCPHVQFPHQNALQIRLEGPAMTEGLSL